MVVANMMEDQYVTWMDDSKAEEMDDAEITWENYCQEMPFAHSFTGE